MRGSEKNACYLRAGIFSIRYCWDYSQGASIHGGCNQEREAVLDAKVCGRTQKAGT